MLVAVVVDSSQTFDTSKRQKNLGYFRIVFEMSFLLTTLRIN